MVAMWWVPECVFQFLFLCIHRCCSLLLSSTEGQGGGVVNGLCFNRQHGREC